MYNIVLLCRRVIVMAVKKKEIYNSLWDSCDKLRGGMDASQYKDYIAPLGGVWLGDITI